MGKPLFLEIREKPLTTLIVAASSLIWLILSQRGWGYARVGTSYEKVVEQGQYWRLLVSQLSHVELMHLVMNMSSLWSLGFVEKSRGMGTMYYLKVTVILMVFSKLMLIGFYHVMINFFKRSHYRRVTSVGYSSVVFGWMSNLSVGKRRTANFRLLGMSSIPMSLAPFASLIMTSLLIPRSSFFGHLSGILVGYLVGFGYFDWFNAYWAVCLCLWMIIGLLVRLNDDFNLPFLNYDRDDVQILIDRQIP